MSGNFGAYYGDRIKKLRQKHGLTQEQLWLKIGLSSPSFMAVCRWENNKIRPRKETLFKIAEALGEKAYDVFPELFQKVPMTLDEYQLLAARTMNQSLGFEETAHHALHGMASEVGEIHGLYQKFYQGHEMDDEHVKKEVGDLLWMIAEFCSVHGWKMGDVAQMNIDKLNARYPHGFCVEQSLHRKAGDI